MDGNGDLTEMSWTDPNEGDAFLALDRNGNGAIDNGGELFGNYTEQPASENANGYLALAVFDQVDRGGNGDGLISDGDQVYESLLVWVDANQNGLSEGYELSTLADAGVENLELDYVESGRRDRYGNVMPFKSSGRFTQGGKFQTVDVFLLTYEEGE